jgi:hypothetical protein
LVRSAVGKQQRNTRIDVSREVHQGELEGDSDRKYQNKAGVMTALVDVEGRNESEL